MKHKDYQRAIDISRAAVNLMPDEKTNFLMRECGENADLRRLVDRLLEEKTGELTQKLTAGREERTNERPPETARPESENRVFGHYRIVHKISTGGMGEVYLANDLNLDRKVALKLLPRKLTTDGHYLQRFKQEARAASALNHPHILTVFEFGQNADGVHYIATEFVEGRTLNKFCAGELPDLSHKLDILIQVASALSAAHDAGIVHRDVKPENIIVRPDGYVKVLDFGLAKLIERDEPASETDEHLETLPLIRTNPGVIMGTVSYMSPEQAKGRDIDARTDIFSFGVLLYEMMAGYLPFEGGSAMEMIAEILRAEPKPLDRSEIPEDVRRIIEKTLRKDRDERYQTMKDLLVDLTEAKREADFRHKLRRSFRPAEKADSTADNAAAETLVIDAAQDTTRIESGRRFDYFHIGLIVTFAAFGALAVWWQAFGPGNRPPAPDPASKPVFKTQEITNWANSAGELSSTATFSPDGRFIAFGSTEGGTTGIWVKQLAGGDALQVTKDEYYNRHPIWSPDGNEIVYYSKRGETSGLWRVSLTGGRQILVADKVDNESRPRLWSKSGKIYYQGGTDLFAVDPPSGNIEKITDFSANDTPARVIRISPDERLIAMLVVENGSWKIKTRPLAGGPAAEIIESKKPIENFVFHPDGTSLLFSGKIGEFYHIYSTSIAAGGEPVEVSFGDSDNFVQDVTADGARILYSSITENSDLWKVSADTAQESLAASQIDAELWPDVSPDGRTIVYQSIKNLRQGSNLLNGSVVVQPAAEDERPRILAENGFLPQWSPDGQTIVFLRLAGRNYEIWKVGAAGDQPARVSGGGPAGWAYTISPYHPAQARYLSWSPDNSGFIFPAEKEGASNIWTISSDGADERRLTSNENADLHLECPIWSVDGERFAYSSQFRKRDAAGRTGAGLWIYDLAAGAEQKISETDGEIRLLGWSKTGDELIFIVRPEQKTFTLAPPETFVKSASIKTGRQRDLIVLKEAYTNNIRLSPDRQAVAFSSRAGGKDDIWLAPLDGGKALKLTNNNDPRLYYSSLAWAPDGRSIFFGKQTRFTLLSMLVNQQTEKNNENSNE